MTLIDGIREKIARGQFEFSQHAVDQSIVRHISVQELREAIAVGEVIEDYPTDKYGPSCLVFGMTLAHRPFAPSGENHHLVRTRAATLGRFQGEENL